MHPSFKLIALNQTHICPSARSVSARAIVHVHSLNVTVSFTHRPLYRRRKPAVLYPVNERLGGAQTRSGRFGEDKVKMPYKYEMAKTKQEKFPAEKEVINFLKY